MSPDKIIELAKKAGEEAGMTEFIFHPVIERFANLVAQLERERIATSIERLPFGDTAASFAIYVRELKDE
jgi:sensor c-di-GMP phosphodiesterase-like protein